MLKKHEASVEHSCWNKAADNEMVFVIIGRDPAARATVEFWIKERIRLGLNRESDLKILHAKICADQMASGEPANGGQETQKETTH